MQDIDNESAYICKEYRNFFDHVENSPDNIEFAIMILVGGKLHDAYMETQRSTIFDTDDFNNEAEVSWHRIKRIKKRVCVP